VSELHPNDEAVGVLVGQFPQFADGRAERAGGDEQAVLDAQSSRSAGRSFRAASIAPSAVRVLPEAAAISFHRAVTSAVGRWATSGLSVSEA